LAYARGGENGNESRVALHARQGRLEMGEVAELSKSEGVGLKRAVDFKIHKKSTHKTSNGMRLSYTGKEKKFRKFSIV